MGRSRTLSAPTDARARTVAIRHGRCSGRLRPMQMRPGVPIAVVLAVAVFVFSAACRRKTSPPTAKVYVTNEDSGDVSVVDVAKNEVVRTIAVGKRPRGARVSPDGRKLFVAVTGSPKGGGREHDEAADGIAVVDLERGAVERVLPAGPDPEAFDVSADGKTLYVSNEDDAQIAVVDVAAGKIVRSIAVGREPEGVSIAPDGRHVYVASEASSEIDVILVSTNEVVARIPTANRPRTVMFDRSGGRALVTAELGGTIHVVDARSHALVGAPVKTGGQGVKPMGIALSPDGARAYVTNGREGSIAVIDVASQRLERSIPDVGARPWGIAITSDGRTLYVAASPDLAVVDAASGAIVKRIPVGRGPWGVVADRGAR